MRRVQEEMKHCMEEVKHLHYPEEDGMDIECTMPVEEEEVMIREGVIMKVPVVRSTIGQMESSTSSLRSWERLTWIIIVFILVCLNYINFLPTTGVEIEKVTVDQLFARFGLNATWDNSNWKAGEMLHNMKRFHKDGEPVPINGYPYLFVGSAGAAFNKKSLLSLGVTHIVDATTDVPNKYPATFQYHNIRVHDDYGNSTDNDISLYWEGSNKFIEEVRKSGGKVLVHCKLGESRSVSVVAAYLVKKQGMGVDEALDLIKETRPQAKPNHDYMARLRELEKEQK